MSAARHQPSGPIEHRVHVVRLDRRRLTMPTVSAGDRSMLVARAIATAAQVPVGCVRVAVVPGRTGVRRFAVDDGSMRRSGTASLSATALSWYVAFGETGVGLDATPRDAHACDRDAARWAVLEAATKLQTGGLGAQGWRDQPSNPWLVETEDDVLAICIDAAPATLHVTSHGFRPGRVAAADLET